VEVR
jgi:hypothetical protein